MSKKMANAPVFFTLGQVQHNPLLSLESFLPTIQESMRKAGYPDFRRGFHVAFDLAPALASEGGQAQQPALQKVEQFLFSNVKSTSGFVLLTNALSFQTTEYDTFESFSAELKLGLEILSKAVGGLSFVERLGLRYLDAVVPSAGEKVDQYLANELVGLPTRMPDASFTYSFAEAILVAEGVGQVVARTVIQNGPLRFPPDLQPVLLKVEDRFQRISGEHAVLDTDGSRSARGSFDLDDIQVRMSGLHDLIDKCFRASVTDHARTAWGA